MISRNAKTFGILALAAITLAVPAFAGKAIPVKTQVVEHCTTTGSSSGPEANCMTEFGRVDLTFFWSLLSYTPPVTPPLDLTGPSYSVRPDRKGLYQGTDGPNQQVISDWGTNSAVYSLNTDATAVNGEVSLTDPNSRGVVWHFFSPQEFPTLDTQFPGNILPPCWVGHRDFLTTVNWNVFASEFITRLPVGGSDVGSARANFNVRPFANAPNTCDQQQARYRLTWDIVCITRLPDENGARVWVATSDQCEGKLPPAVGLNQPGSNYGYALLQAYGGKRRQTITYGAWRMPFKLILTEVK